MKNQTSYFKFNKRERRGVFFLLLVIIVLQSIYYYIKAKPFQGPLQVAVDTEIQAKVDSLKRIRPKDTVRLFPFNPNYITDYKGYRLGLSATELDRLFAYRKQQKFVNSAVEFQQVTQVSDSLLAVIAPYFKFPKWVQHRKTIPQYNTKARPKSIEIQDLNTATAEALQNVSGIGEVLSQRIVKFRDRLGGFLVNAQLYDVYGLTPDVVAEALKHFQVQNPSSVEKININTATVAELSRILYINYALAQQMVAYRTTKGMYTSWDELSQVTSFPIEKIDRIKLYLTL